MFTNLRLRLATAAVIAGAVFLPSAVRADSDMSTYEYWDGDCLSAMEIDTNGDGHSDAFWFDFDEDCELETFLWNSAGDESVLETMTVDVDGDGWWDVWFVDVDGIDGFDEVSYDTDGDGIADTVEYLTYGDLWEWDTWEVEIWEWTIDDYYYEDYYEEYYLVDYTEEWVEYTEEWVIDIWY